jgi:RimJ/RimL family protein N-acetyltransferase
MQIQFPQEVGLRDARRLIIRPFTEHDADALFAFFQGIPAELKQLAWDRLDSRATVESWARDLDYDKVVPLLALDGASIVADASMHYRDYGPLRRVGRIKWLIHPDYYGAGVGTALVTNFIEMARANGLRRLTCILTKGYENEAVKTLKRMGFEEYILPEYGTDPEGRQVDMQKMILAL